MEAKACDDESPIAQTWTDQVTYESPRPEVGLEEPTSLASIADHQGPIGARESCSAEPGGKQDGGSRKPIRVGVRAQTFGEAVICASVTVLHVPSLAAVVVMTGRE